MTPSLAAALVAEHGSIDAAVPHAGGMSFRAFREFCREHDITAVRRRRPVKLATASSASYLANQDELLVYFVRAEGCGAIKIGVSYDIVRRFEELQSASPVRLEILGAIPGGIPEEARLHRRFAKYRLHAEWYSEAIRFEVARILAEHEKRNGNASTI
jgi:hypothetical protein